ncbi:hypothetical protein BC477_08385 [Clavibacter michiganensis subsp. michiganensis]|uniref:Uncharacterized protein n=1 Tax=Clavibacter michiganensis subsp. michiganensis TaxID=33013 RepID=A0A251XMW0_CLAMM|nr:hypothetical protein BC477_08385 [Clavibacter michiganensis subsp. michiganensis]OUE04740.1 hypothetical protein CMMCAS07_07315 [Clavibacter michiganensis subsp. michiganensis]
MAYARRVTNSDSWTAVQTAAVIVAAVGAMFTLVATIVSAVLSARRDRVSWLREAQGKANHEYIDAMYAFLEAVHSGPLDRALHTPDFVGLDEAWDANRGKSSDLSNAARHLNSVGSMSILFRASQFNTAADTLMALAHPASGVSNAYALVQRKKAIEILADLSTGVDFAVRLDGKLDSFKIRRNLMPLVYGPLKRVKLIWRRTHETVADTEARQFMLRMSDDVALPFLLDWRVRSFSGELTQTAYIDGEPWLLSQALSQNNSYTGTLWAVLAKIPELPWLYALSPSVPATHRNRLYADAAELVRHGGRNVEVLYGASNWIDGVVIGPTGPTYAQIWFWRPPS